MTTGSDRAFGSWQPACKRPGNAVHCAIFQKAGGFFAGRFEKCFQCALADKDFRRKPKAWRGTKLCAIVSGASADSTEPIIDPPNEPFDSLVTQTGEARAA
jgi:hypothetical protein